MIRPHAFVLLLFSACGSTTKSQTQPPGGVCMDALPDDAAANRLQWNQDNRAARLAAAEAARTTHELQVLIASPRVEDADPYPASIRVYPTPGPHEAYTSFHGLTGGDAIYETAPSSGLYFIVDDIGGDGAASLQSKYESLATQSGDGKDHSLHSWHVNSSGQLKRLKLKVLLTSQGRFTLCGCGEASYERKVSDHHDAGVAADIAPAARGFFLLPTSVLPSLAPDPIVELEIDVRDFDIEYTPRTGYVCEPYVC
jgi:hypothetical protein